MRNKRKYEKVESYQFIEQAEINQERIGQRFLKVLTLYL